MRAKVGTFILFLFVAANMFGQGGLVTITSNVPSEVTVCGQPVQYSLTINNPSPFNLSNVSVVVKMPVGFRYQSGSVTGATELNITDLDSVVFSVNTINTLNNIIITYSVAVGCEVIPFISSGQLATQAIRVNYTSTQGINYDAIVTSPITVKQPSLSITSITNQSYSGNIGDIYTRCITIVNGGLGALSSFVFEDVHGTGILVNTIDKGVRVTNGNTETVTLGAADFTAIGDNDNLFENGESIVICETVQLTNCISVQSNYKVYWGCNTQQCQVDLSSANVTFPNLVPNLVFTPTPSFNACMGPGNASVQELKIVNTGTGQAINTVLDIYHALGTGFMGSGSQSYIDQNSFTIEVDGGAVTPIVADSSVTNVVACVPANSKMRVYFTIPTINPGITVIIKWNVFTCCPDACTGYFGHGWAFQGSYNNICNTSYVIPATIGKLYSHIFTGFANNGSATSLFDGETGTFSFIINSIAFQGLPVGNGAYWKVEYTLPACLGNPSNVKMVSYDGITQWLPSSVSQTGNKVTAIYNTLPPFNLSQADFKIDLTADCSVCGSSSAGAVGINFTYVPDNSCACVIDLGCKSTPIQIVCPGCTIPGANPISFSVKRTSYGQPDNNEDGLPDGAGSLDFTKIKTNLAMLGDTITSVYREIITTNGTYPNWQYCYASANVAIGILLDFVDADLRIYQASTGNTYNCTGITPTVTITAPDKRFDYDLSVANLIASGCLPAGFLFNNNDSIIFKPRYKVISNTPGVSYDCNFTNEFYTSVIPNPVNAIDKFACLYLPGSITVMGYFYENYGPESYTVKSCDTLTIIQGYFLSIGPCCGGYAGGNQFRAEYRSWAHIDTLMATLPAGYTFISARFRESRTAGTLAASTSPWLNLTPINLGTNQLKFDMEPFYISNGGTIPYSDDGFGGELEIKISPGCAVPSAINQPVLYDWTFKVNDGWVGSNTPNVISRYTSDYITYASPEVFVQSLLPTVDAVDKTVTWDVSISNSTNVIAHNVWLSVPQISGVNVIEVFDVDNNAIIPLNGSIYETGIVGAAGVRNFKIKATYSSCLTDSIVLYTGWNCLVYPTNINDYPCDAKKITLKLNPQSPSLSPVVISPAAAISLCAPASYTVKLINVQKGSAYDLLLRVILPPGTSIKTGTSQLKYPEGGAFVGIADPVLISGTTYSWNLSALNALLGTDGLKGVTQTTLDELFISFDLQTDCSFTSGDFLRFSFIGKSACGATTAEETAVSLPLEIDGAVPPYTTDVKLVSTYITPCSNNSTLKVVVKNNGPSLTSLGDSVKVTLPTGVYFAPGSYTAIKNAPSNGVPIQYNLNGNTLLSWAYSSVIPVGDSAVFSFEFNGIANDLTCALSQFAARTTIAKSANCVATASNCDINVITGDTVLDIYSYKGYLSIENASATSVANPPSGELVTVNVSIKNTGEPIKAGSKVVVSYYFDSDNDNTYSNADSFLHTDTINNGIPGNGGAYTHTTSFNVTAGNACKILIVLDTLVNACSCTSSFLLVEPRLKNAGLDTAVCGNVSLTLGTLPINGYGYTWTPPNGLDNTTIANPTLTATVSSQYIVTTNRLGCTTNDTVNVTIHPPLTITAQSTPASCGLNDGTVSVTINAGTPSYTYSWSNDSIKSTLVNLSAGFFTVTVIDGNKCTTTATTSVLSPGAPILNAPVITPIKCYEGNDGEIAVSASGGIGALTYSWSTLQTGTSITGLSKGSYSVTVSDATGCGAITSVTLTTPLPIIAVLGSTPSACVNPTGTAFITSTSGGTGGYNYLWSNASTAVTAAPLAAGIHTVTITDANNCELDTVVTVATVNGPIIDTIIKTNILCAGNNTGALSVTASGGTGALNYSWSNGESGATATSISNLLANNYTLTVSDQSGCNISSIATLTAPPPLSTLTSGLAVKCNGSCDGIAILIPSGGVQPYNYTWSNTQTGITLNNVCAGTYSVTITDMNNCTLDTAIAVASPTPVIMAIDTFAAITCNGICNGTLVATASGGVGPYVYAWNNNSNTDTIKNICAGNYVVTVTDNNNCTLINTVNLAEPTAVGLAAVTPQTVCIGQSTLLTTNASGGTAGYNYTWQPGNLTGASITVNPVSTTTYSVTANDLNNCASAVATVLVTVRPPLSIQALGTAICLGDSTTLTTIAAGGNGNYSYSWLGTTNTNASIKVSPPVTTTYSVMITDDCVTPADTGFATVIVNQLPVVSFAADVLAGCMPLCVNLSDNSTVVAGTITNWEWKLADTTLTGNNPNYCFKDAGNYSVILKATSDKNCSKVDSVSSMITVHPLPEAKFELNPVKTTILNPTIKFTDQSIGAINWNWDFGDPTDITNSTEQSPTHTYADTGNYCVLLTVTNSFNCIDTTTHCLVVAADFSFYIPNAFSPNGDGVNELFSGKGIGILEYKMRVFDRWGELIFQSDDITKQWDGRANYGNEIVQQDVYVYIVDLIDIFKKKHKFVGHVTVVK